MSEELLLNADIAAKKWSFEIPPAPIDDSEIAETVTSDVVVVGEGMSGLCTALSATEEGLKTTIVTASSKPVGRGGSVFATYSKVMERLGYPRFDATDFYLQEFASSSYNVDQRKWYSFHNNSETAMNWLIDMLEADGVKVVLENGNVDDPQSPTYQPIGTHAFMGENVSFAGIGITFALKALEKNFLAKGGTVAYRNIAKQLVKSGERVTAVIAEDSEGRLIKYEATKAVVLATGDFSANRDMMAKYCPSYAKYFINDDVDYDAAFVEKGLYKGDGHRMALWAGAAWQRTFPNAPLIQGSRTCSNMPYGAHRGIRINKNGERFMNEDSNAPYTAQAVLREPDQTAYAIWGTNYAYDIGWQAHGSTRGSDDTPPEKVIERWEAGVGNGNIVKGGTIEEVVAGLGLPHETTLATIKRYNELCRAGVDTDFCKKPKYLQEIRQAPFYGGKIDEYRFFSVFGGPRTNHNMQICDENDVPLGGLYAAGTMIGDMYANCYNFRIAGHNYGCCLTFGYLTGKFIAKNE
ncbi:MAG: FAD-dependent oxidoreductase [Oscillospiraceae bacterium]|nr:FAD-dependent oxidoreductase [Oscillospiraceae bacterium]